ncbi:MAG: aminopeptidase [Spirochaetota bacterium]
MKKKLTLSLVFLVTLVALINYPWLVYLAHVSAHQAKVILHSESIDKRLLRGDLPAEERKLLIVTGKIRAFAEQAYGLQNSTSYRKYFDLRRKYLGYNITVTPEFSLKPKAFSFWPIGSFDYLGFFSREMAEDWAERYRSENADVYLSEIGGYSTLGWFDDPLYSTQLAWGEFALARLLAHEIAHERLYFSNDTTTSEILASFIERRLALDYLAASGQKIPSEAEISAQRRRAAGFAAEIDATRNRLETLYATPAPAEQKRRQKRQIFAELRQSLTRKGSPYAGLPALRELPPAELLGNAWLVQFHRYSPQSTALDAVYRKCVAAAKDRKYQCWFEKLEILKNCSNAQRKEWLKGDGSIPEGYCRH